MANYFTDIKDPFKKEDHARGQPVFCHRQNIILAK